MAINLYYKVGDVAPHEGAWIETTCQWWILRNMRSPLTKGRGLKRWMAAQEEATRRSPLTKGRGLKP